jgi:hypothetical protein
MAYIYDNDVFYDYDETEIIVDDNNYGSHQPIVESLYIDPEIPLFNYKDPIIFNDNIFFPYRQFSSDIVFWWNNFNLDKRGYVIDKFGNFHPRENIFWDDDYSWYDLFNLWYLDDYNNYFDNQYIINKNGWIFLSSLHAYMKEIAGKNLAELAKKQCCSRQKTIAEAIWRLVGEDKFKMASIYKLISDDYNKIKDDLKKKFSDPTDEEINQMYDFMKKCYDARMKRGKFEITKFLDKVLKDGIAGMNPSTYKKYLLFKKKYLEKKTIKKL